MRVGGFLQFRWLVVVFLGAWVVGAPESGAAPHATRLQRKITSKKKTKKTSVKTEKEIAKNWKLLRHLKMLKRFPLYRYLGLMESLPPRKKTRMVVVVRRSPPRWGSSSRRPARKQRN